MGGPTLYVYVQLHARAFLSLDLSCIPNWTYTEFGRASKALQSKALKGYPCYVAKRSSSKSPSKRGAYGPLGKVPYVRDPLSEMCRCFSDIVDHEMLQYVTVILQSVHFFCNNAF